MKTFKHINAIAALLVLVGTAASAATPTATNTPFSFNVTAGEPAILDSMGAYPNPPVYIGTCGALGQCQVAWANNNSIGPGSSIVFTLANGSSITATLGEPPVGISNLSFLLPGTILGGTGLFTNATGTFQLTDTVTDTVPNPASTVTITLTGSGTIIESDGAGVTVLPSTIQFQVPQGSSTAVSSSLIVNNQGLAPVTYTASAAMTSKADWLSVLPASGSVPVGSGTLQVTANPSGLALGVYNGEVDLDVNGGLVVIPVLLIVGDNGGGLLLSETGASFLVAEGGPPSAAQTIQVENTGIGELAGLTATTTVTGAGPNWLHASIAPGFASQSTTPVSLSVDPGTLPVGTYYGQVNFNLPKTVNSPQSVSVQMQVVNTGPPPTFKPAAVPFYIPVDLGTGVIGPIPSAQTVVITNPGLAALKFTVAVTPETTMYAPWIAFSPASGSVGPGQTTSLSVSIIPACVTSEHCPNEHDSHGVIVVTFPDINFSYYLATNFTEPAYANPPSETGFARAKASTGCSPSLLTGVFTSIPLNFQAAVGQPVPLEATIIDDCGNNVNRGAVVATFSTGDPPVVLNPLGAGQWAATWTPRNAGGTTLIGLQAVSQSGISGGFTLSGSVAASTSTPIIGAGGIVNAASGAPGVAPGGFISIYGVNFSSGLTVANTPFPPSLNKTEVFLGGQSLPIYFTSAQQIDAIVPYGIAPNSSQQLIIQTGDALSQPEPVTVAAAQPGVFTENQSGSGPGAILGQKPGGIPALNTAANPASAGDALLIFCTGLGTVSPAVPVGSAAPISILSNTDNTVTVTVGGENAQMLFAGLAPGFAGLYQVNVIVPIGHRRCRRCPSGIDCGRSSQPASHSSHQMKIFRQINAIAALLVFAGLGLPAAAGTVSFSINMSGIAPGVSDGMGGETFSPQYFSGTLPPFGSCQAALATDGSSVTFTLASGTTITASLVGEPPPAPMDNAAAGTITGGTGIFTGATGTFQLILTPTSGSSASINYSATGSGTIDAPNAPGGVSVLPTSLQLQAPQGISTALTATLILNNQGLTAVSFTASVAATSKSDWLSVSPSSGSVPAGSTSSIQVTVNPSGLALGVYNRELELEISGGSIFVPVLLIVGDNGANLLLSETGASFLSQLGGSPPASETIQVQNTGAGDLSGLTATTSVTGSGPNWLHAAIASGFATQTSTPVTLSVDPGSLPAGMYSGLVTFSLPKAVNSPQSVSVYMQVVTGPLPTVTPAGFLYQVTIGGVIPPPQTFYITNPGLATLRFTVKTDSAASLNLGPWFNFSPTSGTVGPGETAPIVVSISTNPNDLTGQPPANRADLDVNFPDVNFTLHTTTLLGIIRSPTPLTGSPDPEAAQRAVSAKASSTCTPSVLFGLLTSISLGFQATVGQPAPLEATVIDDCGNNLDDGSVVATFSSGDPAVVLNSLGAGQWAATWTPRNAASNTVISLQAASRIGVTGGLTLSGSVAAATTAMPMIGVGGIVNAASGVPGVAPGGFISIYGVNFGSGLTVANTPFPGSLNKTEVFLGGQSLPIYFTSAQQIDAIVPYDIAPNSSQQLIIQTGDALSQPEPVTVAAAQPGVFTENQSGSGPGAILGQKPGGIPALNTAANPASAGDALLIFCTGLGTVSPAVPVGSAAPISILSNTDNTVTVTVGGNNAQVLFAGLAPGFAGLYQVNVIVPTGIAAADDVPVVLTAAGAVSPPVTVAIQ